MPFTAEQVTNGRKIIEAYRLLNHKKLKPVDHTPLIEKMEADLRILGFDKIVVQDKALSIWDVFNTASELLNLQELGFTSPEDYEVKRKPSDDMKMEKKWH